MKVMCAFNQLDIYNTGFEAFVYDNSIDVKRYVCLIFQSKENGENFIKEHYEHIYPKITVLSLKDGFFNLIKTIASSKIDLFHAHHVQAILLVTFIKMIFFHDIKLILTIHSNFHHYKLSVKLIYIFCSLFAKSIVCNSDNTKSTLPGFLQNSMKTIRIYNGVNLSQLRPKLLFKKAPTCRPKICIISRLVPEKNIGLAIEALHILKLQNIEELEVHIYGDGSCKPSLMKDIEKYNLENISFHGKLPRWELYGHLTKMDVLVVTSKWEGFCNAMVEGLVVGLPVIAPNIKPLPEVSAGLNTIFYKPDDPTALSDSLTQWLNTKSSTQEQKDNMMRLRQLYDLQLCSNNYVSLYKDIINAK